MKRKWISRLGDINKELLLILSIIAAAGVVNFFIAGPAFSSDLLQSPDAHGCVLFWPASRRGGGRGLHPLCRLDEPDEPVGPGRNDLRGRPKGFLAWSDLAVWAGFLLISAYATGSLYELGERRLNELRETYYGVLQILNQFIGNDKFTQNHSYRVSVYATTIAAEMRLPEQQIEDVRAAALLHDIGKLEISREILYKAARLDDDETEEMKSHVEKGIKILTPWAARFAAFCPLSSRITTGLTARATIPRRAKIFPLRPASSRSPMRTMP